jgi:hypothetical protein
MLGFVTEAFKDSQIRISSHITKEEYIRAELGLDGILIIESISPTEFLIHGEAEFPGDLQQAAEILSDVLKREGMLFRFEIYQGDTLYSEAHHLAEG